MNRDDIIRMARDCGGSVEVNDTIVAFEIKELEAFANLVAAAEREACANLCEELRLFHCEDIGYSELPYKECAFNIRERGAP